MMKNKFSITIILMLELFTVNAQQNRFESFAAKQDRLFIKAYEQKDTLAYQKLLDEFTTQYKRLDSSLQKQFAGYAQNAFYNLSCTYSLLNNKAKALEFLKKAAGAGYSNYSHLLQDKDLDNIRTETEFEQMLQPLQAIGDYRYILKKAAQYDLTDNRSTPLFTYQPADDPNLVALRKGFNLDSIAGGGSDILKMINLLHWVHTLIPHDGNHANPSVKNAMSMIAVCKRENRGLNCRGLATVLNECYLSMGFKSRFVTCLPKDSLKTDPDCHVINMVYAHELKKWVWLDPTNDAYVMDEKGELLSIEEIRARIIDDRPLILNPAANWNNKVSKSREDYLYNYMAKNLYMLQCSARSEYNAETSENGKSFTYITLVPLAYFSQQKNSREEKNEKNNSRYRYYQTNNPAYFWKAPL